MKKVYRFNFCTATVHSDYLVVEMNEGITVSPEHNIVLLELVNKHFQNIPFVYISNRIHSYSVNPQIYLSTSEISNLVGFIVVSTDPRQQNQTEVEKKFFKKSFEKFSSMEQALIWKDELLHNNLR